MTAADLTLLLMAGIVALFAACVWAVASPLWARIVRRDGGAR